MAGKVYLVGAGPGEPGLLTLRGAELLARADAVLYDYLVNPAVLRHCRGGADLISLGTHASGRVMTQDEIHQRLAELAQTCQVIVRLKSGDPMVFARAGEELDFLAQRGIDFEIVPGVTAALAAACYAGIPVTHRDAASAVALVTGQEDEQKSEFSLDYAALARFPGTLVLYMGVTTVRRWSAALITAGKAAKTPVAILRRVSLPNQQRIDTTLGEVASVMESHKLRPPVVFVIGEVASHGAAWSWFEKRPLAGQRVLVTRPAHQAEALAAPLAELGAEILYQPAIKIRAVADSQPIEKVIDRLAEFDWLVFSSSNGVRHFFDKLLAPVGNALPGVPRRDTRFLGKIKIAAIGPGTAEELARFHLNADVVPDEFRAEALAESINREATGQRFLLIRASRGREILAEQLAAAGGIVEQVVVYESTDIEQPDAEIAAQMAAGKIEWTTVTSSAIARSLVRLFGESLRKTKLASISPITSGTLREAGLEPVVEAQEYTMAGVVNALQAVSPNPSR
jgi:uroporphyrinogen III methyltransferase / synthase